MGVIILDALCGGCLGMNSFFTQPAAAGGPGFFLKGIISVIIIIFITIGIFPIRSRG